MNLQLNHYRSALNLLHGVGPIKARELIQQLDSLDLLFHETPRRLAKATNFPLDFFKKMDREFALGQAIEIEKFNEKRGVRQLFYFDDDYPDRLRHCDDAPILLYTLGGFDYNKGKFVALVGTRHSTQYGRRLCEELVEAFADKEITVVSGLANGIDAWAHYYSLENKVPTIAVLGHGLDRIYPANNRNLAAKIVKSGALLCEFPPGTNPDRENFPKRNRIVAGMCDATIVVESKISGGSLITAELANDYSRDVFAFPGSIFQGTSQGCNQLIRNDQAHLLLGADDFLQKMGWLKNKQAEDRQRKIFSNLSELQQSLLVLIENEPMIHADILALKAKLAISKLHSELFYLELEGLVQCHPGKRYSLI